MVAWFAATIVQPYHRMVKVEGTTDQGNCIPKKGVDTDEMVRASGA
jgi:hypothetical protein